jgi:MFS family permease
LPSAKIPSPNLPDAPATAAAPLRFAAFSSTNFRLFWVGNAISWTGSLAQQTAQGWLVRQLTPDPRAVTLVAACATLPIIFLSLHAGAVADRVDRRRALLGIGLIGGLLAALIATLIWLQIIQVWHVVLFSLASGALAAFEIPIRQSFVADLVELEALPSAIALNSTAFNTARVIGPALGGILISGLGLAGCFYANAFSFVAIIAGLLLMKLPQHHAVRTPLSLLTIWKGILFVRRHETLRLIILLVAVVSFWAMSFSALLPVFAKDVFHTDARGFSIMMSGNGLGALIAAMSFAASREMRHSGKRLLLGAFAFCISTFCFASSPHFVPACIFLLISGFCLVTFAMTANTLVQTLSPNLLRGRIFSLYSLAMLGAIPLGTLALGALAKWQNARIATQIGTFIASVFVFWMFWKFRSLWKAR